MSVSKKGQQRTIAKILLDFQHIFRHLKKKLWGLCWDFFALQFNFDLCWHCRIQLLTDKISFIISYQLRAKKEKSLFISGSFFSSFSDFEIEVLHREVDGGFAEMKVCRVALSYCFLHSLSEKMNEKYGIWLILNSQSNFQPPNPSIIQDFRGFFNFAFNFLDHFKITREFSKQFFLTAIEAQESWRHEIWSVPQKI